MEIGATSLQSGIVDRERFCIGCGYNLRMLHWQGKCPECGRAVLDSLGATLQSADRSFLAALFWGMVLLSVHPALVIAVGFAGHMLPREWRLSPYLIAPFGAKIPLLAGLGAENRWSFGLSIAAMLVYAGGIWLFTRGNWLETSRANESRTWLRLAGVVSTALGFVGVILVMSHEELMAIWLVMIVSMILELLIIGMTYARLASFAELAKAPRLASVTRWILFAHLLAMLMLLFSAAMSAIGPSAMIILAAVALAGILLWARYLQLLASMLRRRE